MKKKIMILPLVLLIGILYLCIGIVFRVNICANNEEQIVSENVYEPEDITQYKLEKLNNQYNIDNTGVIFIGDSRTVGMKENITPTPNEFFIAKVGMGYNWLVSSAIYQANDIMNSHTEYSHWKIVTNLGINDIDYQENNYINKYNELMSGVWKNCELFIVSVNPCDSSKMQRYGNGYISNSTIENFNNDLKNNVHGAKYINTYIYISESFNTVDGLHYNSDTYKSIYYYIETLLFADYDNE